MQKWTLLALLLVLSPLLFTDVGPGPDPPQIRIHFTQGNQPYTGPLALRYHCTLPPTEPGTPLEDRDFEFTCNEGVCRNEGWFYKFNPCFYPEEGYFGYRIGSGPEKTTGNFAFPEAANYGITLDVETGQGGISASPPCLPLFLAGSLGVAAMTTIPGNSRKRIWN